jgi:hypothetical protein
VELWLAALLELVAAALFVAGALYPKVVEVDTLETVVMAATSLLSLLIR